MDGFFRHSSGKRCGVLFCGVRAELNNWSVSPVKLQAFNRVLREKLELILSGLKIPYLCGLLFNKERGFLLQSISCHLASLPEVGQNDEKRRLFLLGSGGQDPRPER